jgi:hypothetical protein
MDELELLFAKNDLRLALEATARKLHDELLGWNPDELLALPEADVVEHLVVVHSVACPKLRRDEAYLLPVSEQVQTLKDYFGDRVTRRVTQDTRRSLRRGADHLLDAGQPVLHQPAARDRR